MFETRLLEDGACFLLILSSSNVFDLYSMVFIDPCGALCPLT